MWIPNDDEFFDPCRCTMDIDCCRTCQRREFIGRMFIDENGDTGVGQLIEERNWLLTQLEKKLPTGR